MVITQSVPPAAGSGGGQTTVVVIGANGLLGQDMVRVLRAAGHRVLAPPRPVLDITRRRSVHDALRTHRPDAVVNCAAYTAVDLAETDEEHAYLLNAEGPALLAEQCADAGSRLIHISTDYVFDGATETPYPESAETGPVNAYGRGKLAGERAVLDVLPDSGCVLRCSWLYGAGGPNFVRTMIRLARGKDPVDVVDDQYGQPTWTSDVADGVEGLLSRPSVSGILHASNAGETTWYGLAREVFLLLGEDADRVRPIRTSDLVRPASRPGRSTLAHHRWSAAGLPGRRHWREALHTAWPVLNRSGD
ncbi:dTDP-4-dehydrorhamnose reductase [Streptomyces californicus]|uniref:dTDP-4-dehydrorhamnose reductase n=1 Tax=Streptomyces californicus TaxID=67351 RepID=UPI0037A784EB